MKMIYRSGILAIFALCGPIPMLMAQQSLPASGRISLFGVSETTTYDDGTTRDYREITSWITFHSATADDGGFEYALDLRGSAYPSSNGRSDRKSIYDAWVGGRTAGGALKVRVGQMWLNELGGLGSVGGLMAEYTTRRSDAGNRARFGLFGGVEPTTYDIDYVSGVKKGGAWIAFDGNGLRRDVLGYVLIRDQSLTERSVLTTTNFIPVGKTFFVYQAAEYDLTGPGGQGNGGLNYFFANARYTPSPKIELMGTYHKGRSIDARTITQDILAGRPVDQKSLDGYLYESVGGRVSLQLSRNFRVYAGYASDRNNKDSTATGRVTAGLWANNIAGTGFDFTVSDNRIDRPSGAYDAWYLSLGRNFGSRLYLSGDYSTSLSIIRFTDAMGANVETRPQSDRFSLSATWNVNRWFSLLVNAEEIRDDTSKDDRVQLGLTYRF